MVSQENHANFIQEGREIHKGLKRLDSSESQNLEGFFSSMGNLGLHSSHSHQCVMQPASRLHLFDSSKGTLGANQAWCPAIRLG